MRSKYFDSLDGLRAISILSVMWYHVPHLRPYWYTGYLGVQLFFVISGFLITTLLLRERKKTGEISLRNFYVRRVLRIFPLYYGVILLQLVLCFIVPELRNSGKLEYLHNLPAFLTFTSNWFVNPWDGRVIFVIAWSLATEEQFYLFWPSVVRWANKWYHLVLFMVVLIVLNQIVKAFIGYEFYSGGHLLPLTILNSVSISICLGSILAVLLDHEATFEYLTRLMGRWWSAPLFLLIMLFFVLVPNTDVITQPHMAAIALSMTLFVGSCVIQRDHVLRPLLASPPFRYIGMISYGLYLLHTFGLNTFVYLTNNATLNPFLEFTIISLISITYASISYFAYERYFLRIKARWERKRRPVPAPEAA